MRSSESEIEKERLTVPRLRALSEIRDRFFGEPGLHLLKFKIGADCPGAPEFRGRAIPRLTTGQRGRPIIL